MIKNTAIQLGRATALKIYIQWQMKKFTWGDKGAITVVAAMNGLKSKDVKDCIKFCQPKKLPKAAREFTGKATRKQCDDLWAQAVKKRARYKCEKENCTNKDAQAHHIIPRTVYPLRFDLENGICLCTFHHIFWAHKDTTAFAEWVKGKRNIGYLESKRHNRIRSDYEAIRLYLQNELLKSL